MREAWVLPSDELFMLIGGLSANSRFVQVIADKPKNKRRKPEAVIGRNNFKEAMQYMRKKK